MTNENSYLCSLPPEILYYIYTFLSAKDLIKCRQVCIRLKQVTDGLIRSEALWRVQCKKDYASIYKIARYKSMPGLLWFDIYRSLTLWTKLEYAREECDEFASASSVSHEISNFKILRDGVIGVHKRNSIEYYEIETLKRAKRGNITGNYLKYTENDDTILILSFHLQLFIIRKIVQNPHFETDVTIDNVKTFLLIDKHLYYVTLNDDIFICTLEYLTIEMINHFDDAIMSLGFSFDSLHILTFKRNIYSVIGRDLILKCVLDEGTNLLHVLSKYNFLETLDWRIYNQWMYALQHSIPEGPLRDIVTIRVYGDIIFVGSNWGVLRIYLAPYSYGELDLYNSEPVRQFNFMERFDCPVLSMCPIIQIDVLEAKDGHAVIVAMPKKIAVLNFTHDFKSNTSVATLPFNNTQKIRE